MNQNAVSAEERFRAVLVHLAADHKGWHGSAGIEFVELLSEVLQRKAARIQADVGSSGVMADPSDVVSEAVIVVDGPATVALSANVRRILAMERPLGYVVAAVSANLSRAVLSERMGVQSRQVQPGRAPVAHLEDLGDPSGGAFLDRREATAAWSLGPQAGRAAPPCVSREFMGVLVGRFQVRAVAVRTALDVAVDVALVDDTGAGMTSATTRRRLALFYDESASLASSGLNQRQVRAMGWLLFGTERHPEWSLLAECARAVGDGDAVNVTAWQARHARDLCVPRRTGVKASSHRWQPSLFETDERPRRSRAVGRSA